MSHDIRTVLPDSSSPRVSNTGAVVYSFPILGELKRQARDSHTVLAIKMRNLSKVQESHLETK